MKKEIIKKKVSNVNLFRPWSRNEWLVRVYGLQRVVINRNTARVEVEGVIK